VEEKKLAKAGSEDIDYEYEQQRDNLLDAAWAAGKIELENGDATN
jgi:hypothetical protein